MAEDKSPRPPGFAAEGIEIDEEDGRRLARKIDALRNDAPGAADPLRVKVRFARP